MAASNFIIKCKTEKGTYTLDYLNEESSVKDLKLALSKSIGMSPEQMKVLCGYPPKALSNESDVLKLTVVGIKSGETIIIETSKQTSNSSSNLALNSSKQTINSSTNQALNSSTQAVSASSKQALNTSEKQDLSSSKPSAAHNPVSHLSELKYEEFPPAETGIMMRHVVPSNNSCLFTSIYFILTNGEMDPERSNELRKIISDAVSANPIKYNNAYLGMSNNDYCVWIEDTEHWGGAIELAILSEHFKVEIVAVDTLSLTMHHFGESSNFSNRIFLIYDGIHYDPLVLELNNATQTVFPTSDSVPLEMALEIAKEAKSSRQFTDVANFTLLCRECNKRLRGDNEAREHAKVTGHISFGEISL